MESGDTFTGRQHPIQLLYPCAVFFFFFLHTSKVTSRVHQGIYFLIYFYQEEGKQKTLFSSVTSSSVPLCDWNACCVSLVRMLPAQDICSVAEINHDRCHFQPVSSFPELPWVMVDTWKEWHVSFSPVAMVKHSDQLQLALPYTFCSQSITSGIQGRT